MKHFSQALILSFLVLAEPSLSASIRGAGRRSIMDETGSSNNNEHDIAAEDNDAFSKQLGEHDKSKPNHSLHSQHQGRHNKDNISKKKSLFKKQVQHLKSQQEAENKRSHKRHHHHQHQGQHNKDISSKKKPLFSKQVNHLKLQQEAENKTSHKRNHPQHRRQQLQLMTPQKQPHQLDGNESGDSSQQPIQLVKNVLTAHKKINDEHSHNIQQQHQKQKEELQTSLQSDHFDDVDDYDQENSTIQKLKANERIKLAKLYQKKKSELQR